MPQDRQQLTEATPLFLSDSPLSDATMFSFDRVVQTLYDFIHSAIAETPFAICLSGGWGSGKTSILRSIEHRLQADPPGGPQFIPVRFDPWKLATGTEIRDALTHRILERIERDVGFLAGADIAVDRKQIVRYVGERLLKLNPDEVSSFYRIQARTRDTFTEVEEVFKRVARAYLNDPSAPRRLVVFIDDLDRCRPAKVVEALEAVKLFFDLSGLMFIFALDSDQLGRAIAAEYGFDGQQAHVYLEKMFQLTIPLPRKDREELVAFLQAKLTEVGVRLEDPFLARAIVDRFGRNLRNLKLFVNYFSFQRSFLRGSVEQFDDELLFKWLYLDATMPRSMGVAVDTGTMNVLIGLEFVAHGGFLHSSSRYSQYVSTLQRGRINHLATVVYALTVAQDEGNATPAQLLPEQQAVVDALQQDGSVLPTLRVLREGRVRLVDMDLWAIAHATRHDEPHADTSMALTADTEKTGRPSLGFASPLSRFEWSRLGTRYFEAGDHTRAYLTRLMALVMEPELVSSWCDLARVYRTAGQVDAAKALFGVAYQLDRRSSYLFTEAAYMYDIQLNDMVLGSLLYRKALQVGGRTSAVPNNLSINLRKEGRHESAFLAAIDAFLMSDEAKLRERRWQEVVRYARYAGRDTSELGELSDDVVQAIMDEAKQAGRYPLPVTDADEEELARCVAGWPTVEQAAAELAQPPL